MKTESDTPRTDKAQEYWLKNGQANLLIDHAAQLERELAEVTKQRDELADALRQIAAEDYRGNRPQSAYIAEKALAAVKGEKQ